MEGVYDSLWIIAGLLLQQSAPDQRDDVLFGKLDVAILMKQFVAMTASVTF